MKRILFGAAALIICVISGVSTYKGIREQQIQKEIADCLIRFHVRANSDADYDQKLKLLVKDEIVKYLETELSGAGTLDDARAILEADVADITSIAEEVIAREGYDYKVNAYFERAYFPLRMYGDMTFPPGEYEAFRVDIGNAAGRNWWCVLYPPLCFVDSTYSVVPDETKSDFRAVLSDEAYSTITVNDLTEKKYVIRFKYLKFLNNFFD